MSNGDGTGMIIGGVIAAPLPVPAAAEAEEEEEGAVSMEGTGTIDGGEASAPGVENPEADRVFSREPARAASAPPTPAAQEFSSIGVALDPAQPVVGGDRRRPVKTELSFCWVILDTLVMNDAGKDRDSQHATNENIRSCASCNKAFCGAWVAWSRHCCACRRHV